MYPKNWSDQPDDVLETPIIFRCHVESKLVEIRQSEWEPTAFVTVGNLFGSETLRCISLHVAVKLADAIVHVTEKQRPMKPLPGSFLLKNKKEGPNGTPDV